MRLFSMMHFRSGENLQVHGGINIHFCLISLIIIIIINLLSLFGSTIFLPYVFCSNLLSHSCHFSSLPLCHKSITVTSAAKPAIKETSKPCSSYSLIKQQVILQIISQMLLHLCFYHTAPNHMTASASVFLPYSTKSERNCHHRVVSPAATIT